MPAFGKTSYHFLIAAIVAAASIASAGFAVVADDGLQQLSLKQEAVFTTSAEWMSACPLFAVPQGRVQVLRRDERYDSAYSLSITTEGDDSAVMWRLVVDRMGGRYLACSSLYESIGAGTRSILGMDNRSIMLRAGGGSSEAVAAATNAGFAHPTQDISPAGHTNGLLPRPKRVVHNDAI
jgi:hypothetical protein